jgi:hypothetical protein
MEITNFPSSERTLNFTGQMQTVDHINKLEVIVTYNPQQQGSSNSGGGMFKSLKSKLWGSKKNWDQLSDAVLI